MPPESLVRPVDARNVVLGWFCERLMLQTTAQLLRSSEIEQFVFSELNFEPEKLLRSFPEPDPVNANFKKS